MIDLIKGSVTSHYPQIIALAVSDSLHFSVTVPDEAKFPLSQQVTLYIYFHWHQENGPALYGFASPLDRQVFQLIISCSGIGPKIGMAILHHMSASSFVAAIAEENVQALSAVQGIGKKKAETIILYLKDKAFKLLETGTINTQESGNAQHLQEVSQTLASLNYSKPEISSALDYVKKLDEYKSLAFDGLLRKALVYLSKQI